MAKFANFCGKIWQNLGFQMAIFCDVRKKLTDKIYLNHWDILIFITWNKKV